MSNKQLTILCDMDGILADTSKELVNRSNKISGSNQTVADIVDWDVSKCLAAGKAVFACFREPGFFANLDPVPGAIDSLQKLQDAGHTIVIVSTPSGPISCYDKMVWLAKHFPFIKEKDVFLGTHKHLVKGDVLIDDSPHNISSYRAAWPDSYIATIEYAYNKTAAPNVNCIGGTYENSSAAWSKITSAILERSVIQSSLGKPYYPPESTYQEIFESLKVPTSPTK